MSFTTALNVSFLISLVISQLFAAKLLDLLRKSSDARSKGKLQLDQLSDLGTGAWRNELFFFKFILFGQYFQFSDKRILTCGLLSQTVAYLSMILGMSSLIRGILFA